MLADDILDEALVAHVGFVVDGTPRVLPMTYGRVGDALYLHGAVGNAMLGASNGAEVCVTVTLLDGLVLARAAMHHSMNYRCVVLFGVAQHVDDETEKRRAFDRGGRRIATGSKWRGEAGQRLGAAEDPGVANADRRGIGEGPHRRSGRRPR